MRPQTRARNKPRGRSSLDQLSKQRQHRLQPSQLPVLYPRTRRPLSSNLSPTLRPPPHIRPSQCLPVPTYARPRPNFFLTRPDADSHSHRSSAGQLSASVSHTVSTTKPPLPLPTSSARTRRSTSASSLSSTTPVKSTRRRLLPGPSLVVCRAIASVNLCQPAHTHLQPSPTPTTPSSTSSLGSSRSNRQFTLHILPHRPGHISNPRSHEEDACFLIPTTKMRSYLCPPSST
jgi:hypothetical protein